MAQIAPGSLGEVREIDFLGMTVRAHTTNDKQVCEFRCAGGPIAPPHRHAWPESHYVIDGEIEYMVDGAVQRVGAGGFITIPGNTVHALNGVSESVHWIEVTVPEGPADFFAEVGAQTDLDPTQLEGMQRIGAIAARHDVELLLG